ncbi:MAG TPA: hypothetical protein VN253_03650, partial [Kofleriaceae bacterium]|nr:hypothetical protein [Kofleriaceae bacterium]
GFDPNQFANSVLSRICFLMHGRLVDAVRERLHEVPREHLCEAIRSAVGPELMGMPELPAFGHGTY